MKKSLLILLVIVSAAIGAVVGVMAALWWVEPAVPYVSIDERQQRRLVHRPLPGPAEGSALPNFKAATSLAVPAVVHIRAGFGPGAFSLNPFDHYLNPHARSSGSGVILSDDGFIATNRHVIEDATHLEVVMNNNQRFYAKIIGQDPTTDLALLKIKATGLPYLRYGNSDVLEPGDWVLAVGNPFDLTSTVTAGIVSAKARNIDILRDRNNLQVESFLQTDAAVNPGNSGGALVNLQGELVGINTAIATLTGGYAGYSFAIPVSLVKKVMDDLLEFGVVQRGMLGIQIANVTPELADQHRLSVVRGVYVTRVNPEGSAMQAGLVQGDVITSINRHAVMSVSELQEWVARNRPGDKIEVTFLRAGVEKMVTATLRNLGGGVEPETLPVSYELKGAVFEDLSYRELTALGLDGGARFRQIGEGPWKSKHEIQPGCIITHIDKVAVDHVRDVNRVLAIKKGAVLIEGLTAGGQPWHAAIDW